MTDEEKAKGFCEALKQEDYLKFLDFLIKRSEYVYKQAIEDYRKNFKL